MTRKKLFFAIVVLCGALVSCQKESDCDGVTPVVYSIEDLNTMVGGINEDGNFFVNTDSVFAYTNGAIKVEVDSAFFVRNEVSDVPEACSQTYTIQKIDSLSIYPSDTIYLDNRLILPEEKLNDYLVISDASCNTTPLTLEGYVFSQNMEDCPFNDDGDFFIVQLNQAPDSTVNQQLRVELQLNNGRVFGIFTSTFRISED